MRGAWPIFHRQLKLIFLRLQLPNTFLLFDARCTMRSAACKRWASQRFGRAEREFKYFGTCTEVRERLWLRTCSLAAGVPNVQRHAIAMTVVEARLDSRRRLELADQPPAHCHNEHDDGHRTEVLHHAAPLFLLGVGVVQSRVRRGDRGLAILVVADEPQMRWLRRLRLRRRRAWPPMLPVLDVHDIHDQTSADG